MAEIQHRGINFDHIGIGTALLRNRLVVPLNQREYSWEEEHVKDLFHDLAQAVDERKSSYFLGTIVLTRGNDGALEVADGQQRLATTSILLAAIRDYFHTLKDQILVTSLEGFLFTIVRETREIYPRLKLNVDDNEYFKNRILCREESAERKSAVPVRASHERIQRAAELARTHVQSIISIHSAENRIARLNYWVKFIEESALVILLTVADDLNAYVMFETLNDRGLRTSQSDLVKNYLFAKAGDRIGEAQQKWASMNGTLETMENDEPMTMTYLRHLVISLYGHTRDREVFERVKEKVASKQQAIEFLDILASCATDYAALGNPAHSKWNEYGPNVKEYVRTLEPLALVPMFPLMLSVARRFSRQETERSFRQFIFWSVRFLIAGGGRTGATEEALAKTAKEVTDGRVTKATQLVDTLGDVIPSDSLFESRFATALVSKNSLARYYLRAMELKAQGNDAPEWIPNDNTVINLEHVLPEHPGPAWKIDRRIVGTYYKRIGNLVLLQSSANTAIGNDDFAAKREAYKKSRFSLTKMVSRKRQWRPEEIEDRQKALAQIAVSTWPILAK
jgi:hypothetical protein